MRFFGENLTNRYLIPKQGKKLNIDNHPASNISSNSKLLNIYHKKPHI
jgi:hypothetical protein